MLVPVFLALFLPCVGMSSVFVVYLCLLWYSASTTHPASSAADQFSQPTKPGKVMGLSEAELASLPKATGQQLIMGSECAVCLDDIAADEAVRIIPGCNHGFHLRCGDTWLSKHSVCPICRSNLDSQILRPPETHSPC